jgi:5-methylcytosine-specific restriction protein A
MQINSIKRPWVKGTSSQGARNNDSSFYRTPEWRRTRAAFLQVNPSCVVCGVPAQMVDHKVQLIKGGAKHDWSNLQPMCNKCHASKSARESNESKRKK